jgi:hypothetical protein
MSLSRVPHRVQTGLENLGSRKARGSIPPLSALELSNNGGIMRSVIKKIKELIVLAETCQVCGSSGPRGTACPICHNPIP